MGVLTRLVISFQRVGSSLCWCCCCDVMISNISSSDSSGVNSSNTSSVIGAVIFRAKAETDTYPATVVLY